MAGRLARFGALVASISLCASAAGPGPAPAPDGAAGPSLERLKAHVETLASPGFRGRRGQGDGGGKAARYLVDAFRELGLEPLFDGRFTQDIPAEDPGFILGRNVGAKLVGG